MKTIRAGNSQALPNMCSYVTDSSQTDSVQRHLLHFTCIGTVPGIEQVLNVYSLSDTK